MSKSPNSDIIDKIYFRNIYSCQRKIYWYKVKVMETINAVWEHSYGEDCIPNFSANMEQPRHRWYEFKEGFSLTLVERAIRETKKDNKSTSFTVLDPFSGSGTSPLTALQSRCNAIGYEVNPFMSLDRETVERLLQNNLDAKLNSELSKYGYQLDAAHKLFRFITSIFERTPPELITWKFKVIMPVGDWDFSQKIILNFHRMNEVFTSECAFIIVDSNLYLIECHICGSFHFFTLQEIAFL